MLIIDKSQPTNRMYITPQPTGVITTGSTLNLYSEFSKKEFSFNMVVNSSLFPERYGLFIFQTSIFNLVDVGIYNYSIVENGNVLSIGLIKVIDVVKTEQEQIDSNYLYITPSVTNDDFIVI